MQYPFYLCRSHIRQTFCDQCNAFSNKHLSTGFFSPLSHMLIAIIHQIGLHLFRVCIVTCNWQSPLSRNSTVIDMQVSFTNLFFCRSNVRSILFGTQQDMCVQGAKRRCFILPSAIVIEYMLEFNRLISFYMYLIFITNVQALQLRVH